MAACGYSHALAVPALGAFCCHSINLALEFGHLSLERDYARLQRRMCADGLARHGAESAVDQLPTSKPSNAPG